MSCIISNEKKNNRNIENIVNQRELCAVHFFFFNENIELIVMCNLNDINDESIYVYCAQYFEIYFRFEFRIEFLTSFKYHRL